MKTDNELIAEFMGFSAIEFTPLEKQPVYKILNSKGNPVHPYYGPFRSEQMQFDKSWDWLMPVVEKINGLREFGDFNAIPRRRMYGLSIFNPLPEVYQHVVDFIKWYNESARV